jgi:hypothetical protein
VPDRRGSDDLFPCSQGGANRAPLAPAKVLKVDASIPTRRRSSRAPRAGARTMVTASGALQGAAEASVPRPAATTADPEARQEPAVAEAQPVAEARPTPAAAETLTEAEVAAPQQEPAAAVAQPEAEVAAPPQEPALAGSSQATAVEIPDDDAPPPGWDQWGSLPTPAPEPQAGALVRQWDGHMVAGGSRHGAEASVVWTSLGPLPRWVPGPTTRWAPGTT